MGGRLMAWVKIYEDTDKKIERDTSVDPPLERLTYTNPNRQTLQTQALAAFTANRAAVTRNTASVAVANPTNAQVVAALKDALRQLSALEQQNNAIMRLLLGMLDGTD
jgi:hypothetical protein